MVECPNCGTALISSLRIERLDGSYTEQRYCPKCNRWKPHLPGDRGWPNSSPHNLDGPEEVFKR